MATDEGRLWIRLIKGHKVARDMLVQCTRDDPADAMREALAKLDISQPIWLERHAQDWESYAMTRFKPEHFIDAVGFDYMEISYIYGDDEPKRARRRDLYEDV